MRIISIKDEIHMSEIEEIEKPTNPRRISDDLPDNVEILSKTAKLSKDTRNQFFVRFPREVSDALDLDNVKEMEFNVTIPLPDAKPENTTLDVRLIREGE